MSPLTEPEQRLLLRLARTALEAKLLRWPDSRIISPPAFLDQTCGAFVTLHKLGCLRGCVGRIRPFTPLHETVRECAVAAALCDPRFPSVSAGELSSLLLEISVLSPLVEVRPEEIEIGRHGLLISQGSARGLLLPQVATQWNWDRRRFLEETCIKAGLGRNAWLQEAHIEAFTAQVFGEADIEAQLGGRMGFKKPA
jgi:uncharacterized protein